jgi:hypothetical protein
LQVADDSADDVLQRLLAGNLQFDVDLRSKLSRFLMTLIHRSPEGIARIKQWVIEGMPDALDQFRATYDALPRRKAIRHLKNFAHLFPQPTQLARSRW